MVFRGEDSNEGLCGLPLSCGGSRKGDDSDILRVCYLRCKKTIDRVTEGKFWPLLRKLQATDVTTSHDPLLVRNFYFQTVLCGYFVSEFVGPSMLPSHELVRFIMWLHFHPCCIPDQSQARIQPRVHLTLTFCPQQQPGDYEANLLTCIWLTLTGMQTWYKQLCLHDVATIDQKLDRN